MTRFSARYPRLFSDFNLHEQELPRGPVDVEAISGALMLVRRAAMDAVGPWDEAYFLHCEDLDWCMRFRQHGWRIVFVPNAPAIHDKGVSSRSRPIFVEWHKHRGLWRYFRKFEAPHRSAGMAAAVFAAIWLRFPVAYLRARLKA